VIRRFALSISSVRWASFTWSRLTSAFLLAQKKNRCGLPWVEGMVTQKHASDKDKSTCFQTVYFFAQLGCLLILSTPVCFEIRRFIRESSGISWQGGCGRGASNGKPLSTLSYRTCRARLATRAAFGADRRPRTCTRHVRPAREKMVHMGGV
jgi:hypothetical protein